MGLRRGGFREGWLHTWLALGTRHAAGEEQARRVRAVNGFALAIALLTTLHLASVEALTGAHVLTAVGIALGVAVLVSPWLNHGGHFRAAALWLIVVANFGQMIFGLALGNRSGIYLGCIVWAVAGNLMLDPERKRSLVLARGLPVLALGATYAYGLRNPPPVAASGSALDFLYSIELASVAVMLIVITAVHDRTARRRAREQEATHEAAQQKLDRALRESEGRFGLLLQQAGDALLVVEEDGKVVDANARAKADLGLDPTGRPVWEVDTTLSRAVLRPLMQELLAGTRYRAEHAYRRSGGGTFVAEVRAGAIETATGRQLLISARDTTEQRELQSQLLLAERLASVGTLAAGVAHEINNPLSFIHMHVEMLERRLQPYLESMTSADAEAVRQSLTRASEGARRVSHIVGDLMTFARGQDTDVGTTDVAEVLRSTLSLAEPKLRNWVRVERHISAVPPARASASRLGQVFLNLVLNARHALEESAVQDPTISVSLSYTDEGHIEVVIEDNGPGMGEEVASRVFEPFYTTKQAGAGTGLGLFVCRNLITEAGGTIELETAPGQGARFVVRVPAASEQDMTSTNDDPRSSGVRGGENDLSGVQRNGRDNSRSA